MPLLAGSPKKTEAVASLWAELAAFALLTDWLEPLPLWYLATVVLPSWLTSLGVAVHHWVFRKPNRRTPASGFIYSVSCTNSQAVCLWMQMENTWGKQMHKSAFFPSKQQPNILVFQHLYLQCITWKYSVYSTSHYYLIWAVGQKFSHRAIPCILWEFPRISRIMEILVVFKDTEWQTNEQPTFCIAHAPTRPLFDVQNHTHTHTYML